jgi:hypothetical protein
MGAIRFAFSSARIRVHQVRQLLPADQRRCTPIVK